MNGVALASWTTFPVDLQTGQILRIETQLHALTNQRRDWLAGAAYLFLVCDRRFAAAGTVVMAVAIWSAFYLSSQAAPWAVWTVLFFVAVALIAYDTAQDTARKSWWPLALVRVFFGWAW